MFLSHALDWQTIIKIGFFMLPSLLFKERKVIFPSDPSSRQVEVSEVDVVITGDKHGTYRDIFEIG